MAINFPSSPTPGDLYSYNGYIWQYTSGGYWRSVSESDYIYSATTVGVGTSVISGITGGNLYLKSFSGNNISISESNGTLTFSAGTTTTSTGNFLSLSGGTVTGATNYTAGLTANTFSATTYQNLPVSAVTNGTGISTSTTNGTATITNTAPDQTITITGGTNIQINGTYPNFGIDFTGSTGSNFTGGTVSGATFFTNGLTSNILTITGNTNISGDTTSVGDVTGFSLVSSQSVGDEGGEIRLAKAQTNTTLSGTTITIDIFQNRLRFFETSSPNRGAYIDLSAASSGVGSNLLSGGGGLTFQQVQMVAFLSS